MSQLFKYWCRKVTFISVSQIGKWGTGILKILVTGRSDPSEFLCISFAMAEPNRGPRSNKNEDRTVSEARSPHTEVGLSFLSCSRSFAQVRTIKLGLYAY